MSGSTDTHLVPADFDAPTVASIQVLLDEAGRQGVEVALAVESGSRAWGFPSPDSDYDCRFIYVRPAAEHFRLYPPRDVIEFPIDGDLDVGGWDLRKALLLALSGNAVIVEWARSPFIYRERAGFRSGLSAVLDHIVEPAKVAHHYLGLARSQLARLGSLDGDVPLKKLFYLIRPLVALDWLRERDFTGLPPMNMLDCMGGIQLPDAVRADILALVERKRLTRELGVGPVPAAVCAWFAQRYDDHQSLPGASQAQSVERIAVAQAFYAGYVAAMQAD